MSDLYTKDAIISALLDDKQYINACEELKTMQEPTEKLSLEVVYREKSFCGLFKKKERISDNEQEYKDKLEVIYKYYYYSEIKYAIETRVEDIKSSKATWFEMPGIYELHKLACGNAQAFSSRFYATPTERVIK